MKTTIHTLNARDNVMLEVMRDYFELNSDRMLTEIQAALTQTEQVLLSKGIKYNDLKTALTPNSQKREVVMVFDTTQIPDTWYGLPIHSRIIPLISKESNHSMLTGDYIGDEKMQGELYRMLSSEINLASNAEIEYLHSSQFYFVYFNNVTDTAITSFHTGLSDYKPYVGFVDTTFSSPFKTYISTILVNIGIKHRNFIITGHEDDRDNNENINVSAYPYEENGYICKSLQSSLFDLFLSYKIERPVFPGFEADTEFSLNAVNSTPVPLSNFRIRVDTEKFEYLLKNKSGSLKRAGLIESSPKNLETLIQEKISSNYLYNLSHNKQHGTTKFDILLELQVEDVSSDISTIKIMVALEYIPDEKCLRLITLY